MPQTYEAAGPADGREARVPATIHPFHAFLLAGMFPLFLGGLLSDWGYSASYEVQWNNFAAWLILGAMVFAGLATLWSLIALFVQRRRGRALLEFVLLAMIFVLGFINCLVHARDAYGTMPEGLILSIVVTVLAAVAVWAGFSTLVRRITP